mmetsp:Transcript_37014/g.97001  ORF Transcript_37014/g.97001 Transcript_37014/m.97001 type:complete len:561 (-) Transcript_37014:423-2105(-)
MVVVCSSGTPFISTWMRLPLLAPPTLRPRPPFGTPPAAAISLARPLDAPASSEAAAAAAAAAGAAAPSISMDAGAGAAAAAAGLPASASPPRSDRSTTPDRRVGASSSASEKRPSASDSDSPKRPLYGSPSSSPESPTGEESPSSRRGDGGAGAAAALAVPLGLFELRPNELSRLRSEVRELDFAGLGEPASAAACAAAAAAALSAAAASSRAFSSAERRTRGQRKSSMAWTEANGSIMTMLDGRSFRAVPSAGTSCSLIGVLSVWRKASFSSSVSQEKLSVWLMAPCVASTRTRRASFSRINTSSPSAALKKVAQKCLTRTRRPPTSSLPATERYASKALSSPELHTSNDDTPVSAAAIRSRASSSAFSRVAPSASFSGSIWSARALSLRSKSIDGWGSASGPSLAAAPSKCVSSSWYAASAAKSDSLVSWSCLICSLDPRNPGGAFLCDFGDLARALPLPPLPRGRLSPADALADIEDRRQISNITPCRRKYTAKMSGSLVIRSLAICRAPTTKSGSPLRRTLVRYDDTARLRSASASPSAEQKCSIFTRTSRTLRVS